MNFAHPEEVPISLEEETANPTLAIASPYWQLCSELTIHQAALLILGTDPSDKLIEKNAREYEPLVAAITSALERKTIVGKQKLRRVLSPDGTFDPSVETDPVRSTVRVYSLKDWLSGWGRRPTLLFMEDTTPCDTVQPSYLDKSHPHFANRLAAAIKVWEALQNPENLKLGSTPKRAAQAWLRKNAASFGLVSLNGQLNELGIEEIAKVVNWQSEGGAPRTGGARSAGRHGRRISRPIFG